MQRVARADGEQRRPACRADPHRAAKHPGRRRVGARRQEAFAEAAMVGVWRTSFSSPQLPHARRHAEIEAAVIEDRGRERRELMPVAQPQQRHGGEVRARQLAADRELLVPKRLRALAQDPERRRLAIVRAGRIGVLRREPILDRDARHARNCRRSAPAPDRAGRRRRSTSRRRECDKKCRAAFPARSRAARACRPARR